MDNTSERRLAENEVIFRSFNEEAKSFVMEDAAHTVLASRPLRFFCECSDLQCTKRIPLTAAEYEHLHQTNRQFILKPGHDIPALEHIVAHGNGYIVVEKVDVPPTPRETIEPSIFL